MIGTGSKTQVDSTPQKSRGGRYVEAADASTTGVLSTTRV